MSVILNNTVISNFVVVRQMDLLRRIIGEIYITQEVIDELKNGIGKGYLFLEQIFKIIEQDNWILVTELSREERLLFDDMPKRLGQGERSCLAVAQIRGWSFFSDDKLARTYAKNIGIHLGGTFGLLVFAVDNKMLPEYQADEILQDMVKNNYRSPYLSIFDYRNSILS